MHVSINVCWVVKEDSKRAVWIPDLEHKHKRDIYLGENTAKKPTKIELCISLHVKRTENPNDKNLRRQKRN